MVKKQDSNVSNELIFKQVKSMQTHVAEIPKLRTEIHELHTLVREGFSALKAHIVAAHSDQLMLEQRMLTLEADMHRVKQRLDIGSEPGHA
ncbi:MAG: hypothetical protein ACREDH_08845 [Methylocella sp.]